MERAPAARLSPHRDVAHAFSFFSETCTAVPLFGPEELSSALQPGSWNRGSKDGRWEGGYRTGIEDDAVA